LIIHVKTVGTLKSLQEGTKLEALEVPEEASVSQVLERLKIRDWEIGFVLVNGERATMKSILKEDDSLTLVAPLAGG
jgi:sulfur carrier protein ThiS